MRGHVTQALVSGVKNIVYTGGILIVFWLALGVKVDDLKTEINTTIRVECLAGSTNAIISKYNDSQQVQISRMKTSAGLDRAGGHIAKAINDENAISRLKNDLIVLPKQDCSQPFLP